MIFLFLGIFLSSCQKQDSEKSVDLINVVREGATIPAYIYGNTGSKTFIILLHGGPGGSGLEYRGGIYSEGLEEDYAVVYTDQRSQGMAQGNFSSDKLTVEFLAGDVYALALSLQKKYGDDINLFLLGHSWGGMLGTEVMVNPLYSSVFKGWIEVDGAHDFPLTFSSAVRKMDFIANEQLNLGNSENYWNDVLNTISDLDTTNQVIEDFSTINTLAFEAEATLTNDLVLSPIDLNFGIDQLGNSFFKNNFITSKVTGAIANNTFFSNGLFQYSLTEKIKTINKPTLLLWGRYDMVVSDELAFSAFNELQIQEKELFIFENSAHSPMVTEPRLFVSQVSAFVKRYR